MIQNQIVIGNTFQILLQKSGKKIIFIFIYGYRYVIEKVNHADAYVGETDHLTWTHTWLGECVKVAHIQTRALHTAGFVGYFEKSKWVKEKKYCLKRVDQFLHFCLKEWKLFVKYSSTWARLNCH